VAVAVVKLMSETNEWAGQPAQLLETLMEVAGAEKIDIKAKAWPKAAHILTRRLKEVKPNLAAIGITVVTDDHIGEHRAIRLLHDSSVSSVKASEALEIKDLDPDATVDATDGIASALTDSGEDDASGGGVGSVLRG